MFFKFFEIALCYIIFIFFYFEKFLYINLYFLRQSFFVDFIHNIKYNNIEVIKCL